MLTIWSLVRLPFLNPVRISGSSWFTHCWNLAWRILSITLLACEMTAQQFELSLALSFFEIGMKTDLFQSYGHCWLFQICWHIECSTFIESSFKIWSSSTGIPSPLLVLLVLILPKAHLISHSEISGSRWVITPLWLSGSWRSFLYSSSVYSCHLFLISSASVWSIPFLSFIEPNFTWNVLLVSWRDFLEEISSLKRSPIIQVRGITRRFGKVWKSNHSELKKEVQWIQDFQGNFPNLSSKNGQWPILYLSMLTINITIHLRWG